MMLKTSIPSFLYITNASVHDVNIMDIIPYEAGSFYVVDKGYIDFLRLYKIHTNGSFFVTRAKENMRFKRMYSRAVDKTTGVIKVIRLESWKLINQKKNILKSSVESNIMTRNTTRILFS